MKIYKYQLIQKLIYHFICKDFCSVGESQFEANLVFFAAGATIDHFAHRSNQVGVHPFIFQLHGFKFILMALLI